LRGKGGFQVGGYEHVFTPLKIGRIIVKNRIESSPAIPFLASADYFVTRELIEWNRAIAKGGAGVVTIGDTQIDYEDAKRHGRSHTLCLGDDKAVNGLSVLAETIHRHGAVASIELNFGGFCSPTAMTVEQIKMTIDLFINAVNRCVHAGMEMVMIHGAHGHLVGQFFSPLTNKRSDHYGGSLRKRAQFAIELLGAIREKVDDKIAIEYRISADELVPGAPSVQDTIEFAKMIEDKIDLLHVSAGNLYATETGARMIQPLYVPRGVNVLYAERFKKEIRVPITTVGSITMDMAEEILAQNRADMVAMIRQIITDPDCVRKAKNGEAEDIRPCIRCNTCLGRSPGYVLPTRCAVNPVAGREIEFISPPTPAKKKRVVVVGGGPGGMEAAKTAARRGHAVILFEKNPQLGGALMMASAPPFKEDVKKYLDWARQTTMKMPNIDVRLSTEATPETITAEHPDVLIIAVGAVPFIPRLPGVDRKNVVWAGDVDMSNVEVGNTILVAGAGVTGCETALHLVKKHKEVTIIDMLPLDQIAIDAPAWNVAALRNMLKDHHVDIRTEVRLEGITETGAILVDREGKRDTALCDTVVLSLGVTPRTDLVRMFENLAPEVYTIGDCRRERGNIWHATTDGFNAAMEI
jgi:2,4-dienoyl-CoA reductase-like NADH-dependent reductase (Old Yellow Enzyme family)/thioredoxin reductase